MIIDNTGRYAETLEELWYDLEEDKERSLPEFELLVKELVEEGFIDYIEGKGYILSKKGVKRVEKERRK